MNQKSKTDLVEKLIVGIEETLTCEELERWVAFLSDRVSDAVWESKKRDTKKVESFPSGPANNSPNRIVK